MLWYGYIITKAKHFTRLSKIFTRLSKKISHIDKIFKKGFHTNNYVIYMRYITCHNIQSACDRNLSMGIHIYVYIRREARIYQPQLQASMAGD